MTSIEFIAHELLTTPAKLRERNRNRELVRKRWVAMCFYKLMGLSTVRIAAFLNLTHHAVSHGLKHCDENARDEGRRLYNKYTNKEPDEKLLPHKTKIVKIPNYRTGEIIYKEVQI